MGGSGGGGKYPSSTEDIQAVREEALRSLRQQKRDVAVNEVLSETLRRFNDRDVELTRDRLEAIKEALGPLAVDFDRLLFGGSVAKHTYVDGLSDIDALVVIDAADTSPGRVVEQLRTSVSQRLSTGEVVDISAGRLAVTVRYSDGTEIQLLPAVERDGRTSIASEDGRAWRQIRPRKFAEKLTQVNQANGQQVVPTIKLAKAALQNLPEAHQLSGYHVEAIAVDAFRSYEGRRDRASMLVHLIRHAEHAILRPTGDITGQSVHIDQHLGPPSSQARRNVSAALGRLASQLADGSADDYRRLLDD
ncbi:MAG: CBASS oligonucleotide cyclase [Streptosporangiaceae bacterium]